MTFERRALLARAFAFALAGLFLATLAACTAEPSPTATVAGSTWADKFAACMSDRGWEVTVSADGGVESEYTDAQADQFNADRDECNQLAGTDQEPTEEEYEAVYAALLANRDCIIEQGYDLQPAPTYQAWRDIDGAWNPFVDLPPDLPTSELQALIEACRPVGT